MKCVHCEKEIGSSDIDNDTYDLYVRHRANCHPKQQRNHNGVGDNQVYEVHSR
jgi:hypothetical protein